MKQKLKGCRPSHDVIQDYSSISAQLGDAIFQIHRSHQKKQVLLKRQEELALEMDAAQAQEKTLAEAKSAEISAIPAQDAIREVKPEVVNG